MGEAPGATGARAGAVAALATVITTVIVTALAVVLVPVGPTAAATGAAAERAEVRGRDFPTFRQVLRSLPHLRGGTRELTPVDRSPIVLPTSDCVAYANSTVPVRSSRVASYDRRDESVYFAGQTYPVVGVYRFRSQRQAARSLRQLRHAVRRCLGRHEDPSLEGYATTYRRLEMPRYGRARLGFRMVREDANTGADWFAETWVLRGRHLVNVRLQHDLRAPAAKPLLSITRKAVNALAR